MFTLIEPSLVLCGTNELREMEASRRSGSNYDVINNKQTSVVTWSHRQSRDKGL